MFTVLNGNQGIVSREFQTVALVDEYARSIVVDLNRYTVDRPERRGHDVPPIGKGQSLVAKTNTQHGHGELAVESEVSQSHRQQGILGAPRARAEDEMGWFEAFQQVVERHRVEPRLA